MPDLNVNYLSLPEDTKWPTKLSQLILILKEITSIEGAESLEGVVISETTPVAADQDKLWARTTEAGRVIEVLYYQGAWKPIPVVLPEYARADLPSEAQAGELARFGDKGKGLGVYRDGAWTSNLAPTGPTADRPTSPPTYFIYFDTDIKKQLRWTGTAWTTVEGGLNETRMFTDRALTDLLTDWPGWVEYTGLAGRVPRGADADTPAGNTGGRESVTWKVSKRNADIDTDFLTVTGITIDGVEGDGPNNAGYGDENEVNILNPYRAVVWLRKETH